jgi:hypothetical protein
MTKTDDFLRLFAKSVLKRHRRLNDMDSLNLILSEMKVREIESLYKINTGYRTQELYNDVLIDILDILEIDYEIHNKTGLKILSDK